MTTKTQQADRLEANLKTLRAASEILRRNISPDAPVYEAAYDAASKAISDMAATWRRLIQEAADEANALSDPDDELRAGFGL